MKIMSEMHIRGYFPNQIWSRPEWRGTTLGFDPSTTGKGIILNEYPEHDNTYLSECIENLLAKGIDLCHSL
jgi:uncharacterized protein (TIGR02328 family)